MKQEEYGMWLCSIEGIGSTAIRKLIDEFGTPEEIYKKTEEQFINSGVASTREAKMLINSKRQFRYRAMREKIASYNMQMASYFSEQYPERLRQIPDFPKKNLLEGRTAAGRGQDCHCRGAQLFALWERDSPQIWV